MIYTWSEYDDYACGNVYIVNQNTCDKTFTILTSVLDEHSSDYHSL